MTNRALLVGINDYPGTGADLAGCVNDVLDVAALLREPEFGAYDVEVLCDAGASKGAVVERARELISATGYRDRGVVWYSGHGTWVPDRDGDEEDGRDEALVMYDYASGGLLTDDEIFQLYQGRRYGSRHAMFTDSCHSGTVTRGIMEPVCAHDDACGKFLPPVTVLPSDQLELARAVESKPFRGRSRSSVLHISGCADHEYSYDARFGPDRRPNGAFTYVALQTLRAERPATYADWHAAIRRLLPSAVYPQTPQLAGSYTQERWAPLA